MHFIIAACAEFWAAVAASVVVGAAVVLEVTDWALAKTAREPARKIEARRMVVLDSDEVLRVLRAKLRDQAGVSTTEYRTRHTQ